VDLNPDLCDTQTLYATTATSL